MHCTYFMCMAFETHGSTHDSTQQFLCTLDIRVSEASGDARESSFLWQRLSVLIQRFNAIRISETFHSDDITDLTTCGDPARLASRLNWISTPPLSSLQPYTPVRPGRVQLEYVVSWTSSTSAIYGRFWELRGRTA